MSVHINESLVRVLCIIDCTRDYIIFKVLLSSFCIFIDFRGLKQVIIKHGAESFCHENAGGHTNLVDH